MRILKPKVTLIVLLASLQASGLGGPGAGAQEVIDPALNDGVIVDLQVESQSTSDQTDVPLTWGQVFSRADVPAGTALGARIAGGATVPLQVDAKATHADGSLRHVVLTTRLPTLSGDEGQTLELVSASDPLPGDPLSVADLLATSFDAVVTLDLGGTIYSASARELLQADTSQTWLAGPLVSEWMVSAPFQDAADQPHPHLTARFNVRAHAGMERVRVDVVVENNWAYEPNPQNFTYDVTVTVGGTQVLAESDLTHYAQARWRKVFWWGAAPQTHVRHDMAYLIATGAVPNYDSSLVIPESDLADMEAEWTGDITEPMGIGLPIEYMPAAGGRRDIGLLPRWAARYLLSMDPRAKIPTLSTGDLAGSWPIHYRDKDTDLPVSLDDYPYMTLLGTYGDTYNPGTGQYEAFPECGGNCSTPYEPDTAHQPSLVYLPYLVTGDHYYLEELQFWANWNMFSANPYYREFEQGLFKWEQVRGQGWSLRTLGQAAYITPDGHPLKDYFVERVGYNLEWYRQAYPDNVDANQLGFLTNGYALVYNDERGLAPWQDDFFTSCLGHLVELGFSEALPLLQWKAKFSVGRMIAPGYCWIFGAAYSLNVRDSASSSFYTTFAQAYDATVEPSVRDLACASQEMADALGLVVGEMTGYSYSTEGYPSNMQPALAMAVQSGISGADEAWAVFMNRSVKPDYSRQPNFAIVPRSGIGDATDLALLKSAVPNPAVMGEPLTYTLKVTNGDSITATNVLPTDTLPLSVTFGSFVSSQGVCSALSGSGSTLRVVGCDLETLANGTQATVTLVVTPTASGTLTNTASVVADQPDANPGDNTATLKSYVFETEPWRLYLPLLMRGGESPF